MAGYSHVSIDGTLIETDRCRTPGPTPGVDLWWSGKHANHGGNIQVITAPDGWPLWTSPVRPGREHDTTALRAHPEILPALATWIRAGPARPRRPGLRRRSRHHHRRVQETQGRRTHRPAEDHNKAHNGKRAIGERGNSLLKTTFKALRNVSLCPWRIGAIVAAALVILHIEHDRTT